MQNYIPGDWFVSNTNSSLITSNNGEQHNWQMANVCQVYGINDEQRQATAKLIATSPEMIDELKTTHDFLLALYTSLDNVKSINISTTQQLLRDRMAEILHIIDKATK